MALPRIGFNEGSLLRRTLLHVVSFVLGSMAFIGIVSFVLVSIAKGVASPQGERAEEEANGAAALNSPTKPVAAPLLKPPRTRGLRGGPAVPGAAPAKDD